MNLWERSETIGKRVGWIVSSVSMLISALSLTIASCSLQMNVKKNSADVQKATAAQQQTAIIQALGILRGPSGPGTNLALEFVARNGIPVPELRVEGAYLEHANLSNLKANKGVFDHANLGGAIFTEADIGDASFVGANLSGALLRGLGQPTLPIKTIRADFVRVAPEEADPTHVIISNNTYRMNFTNSNLIGAALDKSMLSKALFRNADLTYSTISDADLTMVDFTGAITKNTNFSNSNFGLSSSAARITQQQLDAACSMPGRPAIVPNGLQSPKKTCRQ